MRDLEQADRHARRKRDTHRKIVAGAAVLSAMSSDERVFERIMRRFDEVLTRPCDRRLFGLPEHPPGSPERASGDVVAYSREWMQVD